MKSTLTAAVAAMAISSSVLAAGNVSVEESVELNVKPAAVWALIGDYNALYRWHPAVASSDRNDNVRVLTLGNGAQLTETLTAQDDAAHSYSYTINTSPLPVADYDSTIQVTASANGTSKVTWRSSFNAAGTSDTEAADVIRGVYRAGLDNLAKLYN